MFGFVCCFLFMSLVYDQVETRTPPLLCVPLCRRMYCPQVLDHGECPICKCIPEPVKPCLPAICPTIKCANGLDTDKFGCRICKCKPGPIPPVMKKCPKNSRSNIKCFPEITKNSCSSDVDCLDGKICCFYGCSKKCIHPINSLLYPKIS